MAVINQVTWKSLPLQPFNLFEATYNAGGAGQYNFNLNAANAGQLVIPINPNYVYLIAGISFSADIPEGTYLESLTGIAAETPAAYLRFERANEGANVYPYPIRLVNYVDNQDFQFFFYDNKGNNNLLINFDGVLNQVAATVGKPQVRAQITFTIYQEINTGRVQRMLRGLGNSLMVSIDELGPNIKEILPRCKNG